MNADWTKQEVTLIVADYFSMLEKELGMQPYNKAQHRRLLLAQLGGRNHGAIEFKHQNISAALSLMGLPFIPGYKPRYNFQREMIVTAISEYLAGHAQLKTTFESFADAVPETKEGTCFVNWRVEAPFAQPRDNKNPIPSPIKINYLEREQHNASLGEKGEALALAYERYQLIDSGKAYLADQIEWVSQSKGDGLGYDILSRSPNGKDKYIEVKTTKLGKEVPFYFSANEYRFSLQNAERYHLYRIFDFATSPKLFTLQGSFAAFCNIEPIQYRGSF